MSIVSQGAWLAALHEHPGGAATGTSKKPPAEFALIEVTVVVVVQPLPCSIVTTCPAIVSVPLLGGPVVAETLNTTAPSPARE